MYKSSIQTITSPIWSRIHNKSFKDSCTTSLESLRYIQVPYIDFNQNHCLGELIVNKNIADTTVAIFEELYRNSYPIEKMILVDNYNADDNLSMADNNTSCFNYRTIDGESTLSMHSKGLAIDINPLYNPYIREKDGSLSILPANGSHYVDRSIQCPYFIKRGDLCYQLFTQNGFTWGGDWTHAKDYQHFEIDLDRKEET